MHYGFFKSNVFGIRQRRQILMVGLSIFFLAAFQNCGQLDAKNNDASSTPSSSTAPVSPSSSGGYEITLTNGGNMPFSPPILWIAKGRAGVPVVGLDSTVGQRKVCETGDSTGLQSELSLNSNVSWVHAEGAPILPGQSIKISVPKIDPSLGENLFVDFMYGKTRNVCGGVFDIDLSVLSTDSQRVLRGKDSVFSSGAYASPSIRYLQTASCAANSDAVTCVRSLSAPLTGDGQYQVRTFVGYLPSVLTSIENIFGSDPTSGLIVPTSGALSYSLQKK